MVKGINNIELIGVERMVMKNYESDEDYILEILEGEEEKIFYELVEAIPEGTRHLFFKYLSIINTINKMKIKA